MKSLHNNILGSPRKPRKTDYEILVTSSPMPFIFVNGEYFANVQNMVRILGEAAAFRMIVAYVRGEVPSDHVMNAEYTPYLRGLIKDLEQTSTHGARVYALLT